VGAGTTGEVDGGFANVKMLGKEFYESSVSLAVVRSSAKVDDESAVGVLDDFFLAAARLDGDYILHNYLSRFLAGFFFLAMRRLIFSVSSAGGNSSGYRPC